MPKKIPISATILCKNSEKYLPQVLDSLRNFDEVLLLDNGSTDNSLTIAAGYPNCRIEQHEFLGFGAMKNLAAQLARNDWIFSIDSDEIPDTELLNAISALDLDNPKQVFCLERLNHYRGHAIKACGWYPDIVPRIYHRRQTAFSKRKVHERLIIASDIICQNIGGYLLHYSFAGADDLLAKAQFYSSLFAQEQAYRQKSSLSSAISHALGAFLKSYILKKGISYGKDGFLISSANAIGTYFKYIKLAEANQALPISLVITTYNRPDALSRVLESALQQSLPPQEILIADDGSDAQTAAAIQAFTTRTAIPIRHIWQENQGFRAAQSRNRAIAAARSDYIVIIDGDLILHPHFLQDHQYAAKKGLLIQGSRVLLNPTLSHKILNTPIQAPFSLPFYAKGILKRHSALHSPYFMRANLKQENQLLKNIKSCNMGFFRADALSVNGFNNDFVGWGREDSEFVARLYHQGIKRANLRFGGIAYHLWHPEADRASLTQNDALLADTLSEKKTWCENGINAFLPPQDEEEHS